MPEIVAGAHYVTFINTCVAVSNSAGHHVMSEGPWKASTHQVRGLVRFVRQTHVAVSRRPPHRGLLADLPTRAA